jgi:outer membrane protein OmpA-like peptidoglycan-associated protein
MKSIPHLLILLFLASLFGPLGCNTSKSVQGTAIGAGGGAVLGGLIGKRAGNTAVGAIIGGAVGGTGGALVGRYMDKQAAKLARELDGVEVERVGEGILLSFDSGLLFDFDSDDLRSVTEVNLNKFSDILEEYPDTYVLIEGHTDDIGSESYNRLLSLKRAESVASHLRTQQIPGSRLIVKGYGEEQPIATNESQSGRQANRRVDIAIYANEDLQQAARAGKLKSK